MSDVVDRAKDSLNTYDHTRAHGCEPQYPAGLIRSLLDEVLDLRAQLALARDGFRVRPMTETESNLMTQVLKLRRRIADADELHRVELRQLQIKHEQDVIKAYHQ